MFFNSDAVPYLHLLSIDEDYQYDNHSPCTGFAWYDII